jgi:hypothetical protein
VRRKRRMRVAGKRGASEVMGGPFVDSLVAPSYHPRKVKGKAACPSNYQKTNG